MSEPLPRPEVPWVRGWVRRPSPCRAGSRWGSTRLGEDRNTADDGEVPPLDLVLKEALARAQALGKPLLVFVVPSGPLRTSERQVLFGQFLNLASSDALADLALCEVACARMTDLAKLELGLAPGAEPLLVLVETDGARAQPQGLDPQLPAGPDGPGASRPGPGRGRCRSPPSRPGARPGDARAARAPGGWHARRRRARARRAC
jgi:hypothetical protein